MSSWSKVHLRKDVRQLAPQAISWTARIARSDASDAPPWTWHDFLMKPLQNVSPGWPCPNPYICFRKSRQSLFSFHKKENKFVTEMKSSAPGLLECRT